MGGGVVGAFFLLEKGRIIPARWKIDPGIQGCLGPQTVKPKFEVSVGDGRICSVSGPQAVMVELDDSGIDSR